MSSYQSKISDVFGHQGIFYIVGLAHRLNSVQAGIFLSQLLYWHDRTDNPGHWVYKSIEQFYAETALNRSGQETAIRRLKQLDLIEVRLARVPATRHFRIKTETLNDLLSSLSKTSKLDVGECENKFAENQQSITYTTQETNTDSTTSINSFIEFANSLELPP